MLMARSSLRFLFSTNNELLCGHRCDQMPLFKSTGDGSVGWDMWYSHRGTTPWPVPVPQRLESEFRLFRPGRHALEPPLTKSARPVGDPEKVAQEWLRGGPGFGRRAILPYRRTTVSAQYWPFPASPGHRISVGACSIFSLKDEPGGERSAPHR